MGCEGNAQSFRGSHLHKVSVMPKKQELSWLAGILDGEGCIMLTIPPTLGFHVCKVQITNTDEGIIKEVERILQDWQVTYYKRKQSSSKTTRKDCFVIQICRQLEAKFVLEQLLPYIKSHNKIEKAKKVLSFLKTKKRTDGRASNCRKREVKNSSV